MQYRHVKKMPRRFSAMCKDVAADNIDFSIFADLSHSNQILLIGYGALRYYDEPQVSATTAAPKSIFTLGYAGLSVVQC